MNKKILAALGCGIAAAAMMGMTAMAEDGELIRVGYAQVGHESDWRTANTQNYQDTSPRRTDLSCP